MSFELQSPRKRFCNKHQCNCHMSNRTLDKQQSLQEKYWRTRLVPLQPILDSTTKLDDTNRSSSSSSRHQQRRQENDDKPSQHRLSSSISLLPPTSTSTSAFVFPSPSSVTKLYPLPNFSPSMRIQHLPVRPGEKPRPISYQDVHAALYWNHETLSRYPMDVDNIEWVKKHQCKILYLLGLDHVDQVPLDKSRIPSYLDLLLRYMKQYHPAGTYGDSRSIATMKVISLLNIRPQPESWWSFAEATVVLMVDHIPFIEDCHTIPDQAEPRMLGSLAYIAIWSNYASRRRHARRVFYQRLWRLTKQDRQRNLLSRLEDEFNK